MDLFLDVRMDDADIRLALRGHRVLTGELDGKGRYTTRVSGGTCPDCGYEKMHDGTCGVCANAKRIKSKLRRHARQRGYYRRNRGAA